MGKQRTGGMTAIGIMNIVFGSIGTLLCLLVAVGGGVIAAASGTMEAELGPESAGAGEMAATGGAIIAAIGILGALSWALLFVGGIGILKLASWGRKVCIVAGALLTVLSVVNFTQGGVGVMGLAMLGYCITVVALCCTPTWKTACSNDGALEAATGEMESDQFRAAA